MAETQNLNQLVLGVLSKSNHQNHLKQLQSFLTTLGHSQTQFYAFKLVRFSILNLSNLNYARRIFNHLYTPNIYLYTALITAYASISDHLSAFQLYRDMLRRDHPKPNQFIFPHVLKSCNATGFVHAHIAKSGFGRHTIVQTALVDSYSRRSSSDIGCARKVFDEMSEKNVVSWTAMISGYTRLGEIGHALSLFDQMPERDVPSWNAVIAGCTQNGMFSEAISLFRKMIYFSQADEQHNRPNQVTLVCTLSACGHTGMLQLGKLIHGYLYRNKSLCSDPFLSNALVDMYGKCGSLREARKVFNMTSKKSLTSWNSMINCFALHGQCNTAISIYEEMMKHQNDVRPDEITFVGLLNACTHGGLVEEGRHYFHMMTEYYGIEPQIEHYGCLIDILGRAGRFEEALEVIRDMKVEPDEVVWGSLLNGCKVYGNTDLAEFAVKKLIEIDPKNGGYGIMLANLYGGLGKWDEVRVVRKKLKEQNAYKIPGCSWIEVDNEVYQFYSVDKTHPKWEEIYKILQTVRL
ncbi:pentatricopeptide repeat-containing protein At1g33350 [Euphorbia lathyris]|uniref:pentatricopeptide repeat-containing protein At1g33350 n=1 Tax=Euphorbia lathyris TaxID=212925 RepID=UPI003314455B